jgi:hypothetical protein
LYKEEVIKRDLKVSYNPQQNRVVERNNWSIIGSSKAMIHYEEFHMFIWEKVCNIAVYVKNMSHHRILGDKTMKDAFSGVKQEIGHLRIFCYSVYIHVRVEGRTKL